MFERRARKGFLIAFAIACLWQVLPALSISLKPPVDVFAGRSFTLECKVTRHTGDASLLTWTRDDGKSTYTIYSSKKCASSIPVSSSAGLSGGCQQQVDGEEIYTVTIENVTEDAGRGSWICQYDIISANVTLNVQVLSDDGLSVSPPREIVAGRPYNLECKMKRPAGNKSSLSWYRAVPGQASSLIYSLSECTSTPTASPNGLTGWCENNDGEEIYTLRIVNVTENMGQGLWKCKNSGREVDIKLHIKVMVTSVTLTNTPDFLLAGDPHAFTCKTSPSQPPACVTWYLQTSGNVRELGQGDCHQYSSFVVSVSQKLRFTASAADNGAELYCIANNSVTDPPVRSQVYKLNVHYIPKISCQQREVTVFEGQRVKIVCDVTANPAARVAWVTNEREMNNTFTTTGDATRGDVAVSASEIEITKEMPSGRYQIEATNGAGSSRTNVQITVIDREQIPKNLKVLSCTNNQAVLIWASGLNDSVVEYYKLEYKGTGDGWKKKLVRNPGRVKLVETTLNDLRSGVLHQFRLQPDSDIALSEYAKTDCTVEDAGLSKGAMFGVGFAVGFAVLAICVVAVACFLRRRAKKKLGLN